jgi:Domain of unknown function (DUF6378)
VGNVTATDILKEAENNVGGNRDIHGDVDNSYSMVAQFWEVYLRHSNYARHRNQTTRLQIDAADVMQMMSLLKKARFVYATEPNRENFVDDAGYTALAGMISLPKPEPVKQGHTEPVREEPRDDSIRTIAGRLRPRVTDIINPDSSERVS